MRIVPALALEALQPIAAAVTVGVEMGFRIILVWRRYVGIIPPCVLLSWSTELPVTPVPPFPLAVRASGGIASVEVRIETC